MQFITLNDIQDKLLNVTEADIVEADSYVEDTAIRMGVAIENIRIPLTFIVKRLAVCFACYNRCLACVGTDPTSSFDGGNRQDIYGQKLEFYRKELAYLEKKLTVADFVGAKTSGSNINIGRA